AKPKVSKNSAGYYLWNVWDRDKKIFDLTKLLVGSQGTLGIISEILFRLVPFKPEKKLMVVFLDDPANLSAVVEMLSEEKPEELEMYHKSVLQIMAKHYPTLV